jgi:uncharacterized protein (TIGR02246 family)
MTSLDAVTAWVRNYRLAWESNDPGDIANLFSEDAAYFTEPYAKPWLGRDKIVKKWVNYPLMNGRACRSLPRWLRG